MTSKNTIKLTVLILSLPERLAMLQRLLRELSEQASGKSVEILYLGDTLGMSVGEKRNKAVAMAKGEYVAFFDDDDLPMAGYIDNLLQAAESSPDVITFLVYQTYNLRPDRVWKFENISRRTLEPREKINGVKVVCSPPNHLCAWRRDLLEPFPHINKSEDHAFAERMLPKAKNIAKIDKILYHYDYKTDVSRTQTR